MMKINGDVMVKRIFLILFILVLGQFTFAAEEGQIRLGAQGGHVGLMSDVGSSAGNAVGFGGVFNYAVTEEMMLELTYTTSSHTGLRHSDFGAGVNFYFNSYDAAYFYFAAGANFIGHELTAISKSASGFGLYGGFGVDFDLGKNFSSGLQGVYHKAFESKIDVSGVQVPVIQDYVTVMLRLLFVIPKS
jgi:hypothetical protein